MSHFLFLMLQRLNRMLSQLLVELPMTLKGQNGVEFDFQSIQNHFSSLRRKNGVLLCLFPQILGFLEFFSFLNGSPHAASLCPTPPHPFLVLGSNRSNRNFSCSTKKLNIFSSGFNEKNLGTIRQLKSELAINAHYTKCMSGNEPSQKNWTKHINSI